MDGLMQERFNSRALAMELLTSFLHSLTRSVPNTITWHPLPAPVVAGAATDFASHVRFAYSRLNGHQLDATTKVSGLIQESPMDRVSVRQGSMHFCPTKISVGPHFMSLRGPKTQEPMP